MAWNLFSAAGFRNSDFLPENVAWRWPACCSLVIRSHTSNSDSVLVSPLFPRKWLQVTKTWPIFSRVDTKNHSKSGETADRRPRTGKFWQPWKYQTVMSTAMCLSRVANFEAESTAVMHNFLSYSNLALNELFSLWSYQMLLILWVILGKKQNKTCTISFASDIVIHTAQTQSSHNTPMSVKLAHAFLPNKCSILFNICKELWRQKEVLGFYDRCVLCTNPMQSSGSW